MAMQRYKLTVAYDGTEFHGWQAQTDPSGQSLRTVQGVLHEAVARVMRQPVTLTGASRTDAGVHALGQIAQFDADTPIPLERIGQAINSRLPPDVDVRRVQIVPGDFDAIRDATDKQYRYRIWYADERPVCHRHYVYHWFARQPLNIEAMADAAGRLTGEHDFAAFANTHHNRLTTVRRIHRCEVMRDPGGGPEVHVVVSGNGFLYHMMRIIVGTLIEVGRGKWSAEYMQTLLSDPRRELAGPTLPPTGLCLEWVRYPPEKEAVPCDA